jgi:hypothetical protein
MPPPIALTVRFDRKLQKLTGKEEHPVIMNEGALFSFLLMSILSEYSGIESKYPPGALGFTVNGEPPKPYSPLFDGDVVSFFVS